MCTLHRNSCLARLDEKCTTFIIRGKRAWAPAQKGFWGNWFIRGGKQMQGFYCWKVPGVISMVNRSNYTWWWFQRPTEKHTGRVGEEKGTGSSIKNTLKTERWLKKISWLSLGGKETSRCPRDVGSAVMMIICMSRMWTSTYHPCQDGTDWCTNILCWAVKHELQVGNFLHRKSVMQIS